MLWAKSYRLIYNYLDQKIYKMKNKYTPEDVNEWKRQGAVVINDIFSEDEIMAVQKDIEKVFGYKKGGIPIVNDHQEPLINDQQFLNFENIPFD